MYTYRGYIIDDSAYGFVAVYHSGDQVALYPVVETDDLLKIIKAEIDYWVDGSSR